MQHGICISISISICRSDKVLDYDRCWKGLDARHLLQVGSFFLLTRMCNEHGIIFLSLSYLNIIWPTNPDQEWERRSVPQHPGAQCLHQNLPWRIRLIQHQVFSFDRRCWFWFCFSVSTSWRWLVDQTKPCQSLKQSQQKAKSNFRRGWIFQQGHLSILHHFAPFWVFKNSSICNYS